MSVIMPVYNLEEYISASIHAVSRQTFSAWELLIVDDGSTDGTGAVIDSFAARDPRIVRISQAGAGAAAARNAAIARARGEWLAFLDGDDLWYPPFLATMLARLEANGTGAGFCAHTVLGSAGRDKRHIVNNPGAREAVSDAFLADCVTNRIWVFIGAFMVRKALLGETIRFTPGCTFGEDSEFRNKVLAITPACYVPEVLSIYRLRPGSATNRTWRWQVFVQDIHGLERAREFARLNCRGGIRETALKAFDDRLRHEKFRLVYKLIKWGDLPAARLLLADGWGREIAAALPARPKLGNRLKVWLACSERRLWWRLYAACWRLLVLLRITRMRHIGETPY
ncbi:glycosyltransferase family 2 protein [Anaeroselena agilis]|uniref:Glycosyltransferase family A protein n=1 Tax=Anaeroselena agilis TaxID=3063788 RepID=A0ABU3P4N1_9FIRM|nr:glycosyltransferase family A protein [Selenomonadales bacterium 4137-cl]